MDDRAAMSAPVVLFLAREGRADRLAAEHGNDGTGHCRTCPAGPQAGRQVWPCSLARLAAAARKLALDRRVERQVTAQLLIN
jgi:hypothetical protein